MEVQRNHQLKKGTILDGRYEIGPVIGEGGFGITYAGTNRNTGEKTAIKEFFCRDYMDRDISGTGRTVLTADTAEKRFNRERRRFLREARIIKDFSNEPSIVTVLDYFEENETAYIVMEYVDGDTLQHYVESNGKYDPKVLFDELRPLMHALVRLHHAGIIHRDISPDNIIRREDGSLVLVDFGSARNLSSNTKTTAVMFKEGYAPPEQYSADNTPAPATDVYGLSATIYYCLTGVKPVDATQRVLFDDMKTVAERVAVPAAISDMTARGMELMPQKRYQSVEDLLAVIDEVYPYLSPEEKARLKKKKRNRILAAAAVLVVAAGIGAAHVASNLVHYRMMMQDTVVTHFYWDSEKYADRSAPVLENRIKAFAGDGNYIFRQDGKEAAVELPVELLHGMTPDDFACNYLIPMNKNFILYFTDDSGEPDYEGDTEPVTIERSDIEEIRTGSEAVPVGETSEAAINHIEIVLNETGSEKAHEFLAEKGTLLHVSGEIGEDAFSKGDGKTLYILVRNAADADQYNEMIQCALEKREGERLTVEETGGGDICGALMTSIDDDDEKYYEPSEYTELEIEWETVSGSDQPGAYQCDPDKLSGETIVAGLGTDYTQEDRADWVRTEIAFKGTLDKLQIPYAFGTEKFDKTAFCISVSRDDLMQSEALLLGNNGYTAITNGYRSELTDTVERVTAEDGSPALKAAVSEYNADKVTELVKQNKTFGLDRIYLKYNDIPLAYASPDDVVFEKDEAYCIFREFCTEDLDDPDRLSRHLDLIAERSANQAAGMSELTALELHDRKGRFERKGNFSDMKGNAFTEEKALVEQIRSDTGYDVKFGYSGYTDLEITYEKFPTENFETAAAEAVEKLLTEYEYHNNRIQFHSVSVYCSNEESKEKNEQYKIAGATAFESLSFEDESPDTLAFYLSTGAVAVYPADNRKKRDEEASEAGTKIFEQELEDRGLVDEKQLSAKMNKYYKAE